MVKNLRMPVKGSFIWFVMILFIFALSAIAVVVFVSCSHIIWANGILKQHTTNLVYFGEIVSSIYLIALAIVYPYK